MGLLDREEGTNRCPLPDEAVDPNPDPAEDRSAFRPVELDDEEHADRTKPAPISIKHRSPITKPHFMKRFIAHNRDK